MATADPVEQVTNRRRTPRPPGRNDSFFALPRVPIGPNRLWIGVFAVWSLFLTGVLEEFTGSPGVLQAWRLGRLLESKRQALAEAESGLARLRQEREALETNRVFQEREVRRVLGYVAPGERVFDFSGE